MKLILNFIVFLIILPTFLWASAIIEPGDKVLLRVIGVIDKEYQVEPDGSIDFSLTGKLKIAGFNKQQAIKAIKQHLSPYLKNKDLPVFLSIKKRVVERHQDQISVFGEVRSPGAYPYRKALSVLDYIVLSGGTTRFALTDSIKVICLSGEQLTGEDFNLQVYSTGATTKIPKVKPGCVIYIPEKPEDEASWLRNRPEQVIHIIGQVSKPGRYEFSDDFGFLDILSHAGGINLQADMSKVSVISKGRVRIFNLEAYLRDGGSLPLLSIGDVIYIPERPITNRAKWTRVASKDAIYLIGAFQKPGRYDYLATLSFLDYFSQAGGPTEKANLKNISIIRDNKRIESFSFDEYYRGNLSSPPELRAEDMIYIPPKKPADQWTDNDPEQTIYLMGGFKAQGRYFYSKEMGFLDYLSQGGGPTIDADLSNIGIIRNNQRIYTFDFLSYQKGERFQVPNLEPEDMIVIPQFSEKGRWTGTPSNLSIYLVGALKQPGRYDYSSKLSFLDYFSQAGGPLENADIRNIILIRKNQKRMIINFHLYQAGGLSVLPKLQAEDLIYIPTIKIKEWVKKNPNLIVNVMGEVNAPGRYEVDQNNLNIIDILAAAGGPGSDSDITEIKIIRRNPAGSVNQQNKVEVMIFDFEGFQKSGDTTLLPNIQLGDTVFVPNSGVDYWEEFKTIGGTLTTLLLLLLLI